MERPVIIGTGIDIVEIDRVRRLGERYGKRFLDRVFTPGERARCTVRRDPWPSLAARLAAKEAGMKCLGLGLDTAGWHDFEVTSRPGERPRLALAGRAAARARELGVGGMWVSLSHSRHYAVAHVVAAGAASHPGQGPERGPGAPGNGSMAEGPS